MKTIQLFLAISLLAVTNLQAEPVSRDDARKIAILWYQHISPDSRATVQYESTALSDGTATYYTFVFQKGGFVIVAADDASVPILGYSEKNPFPLDVSCPAVKEWLEDYSRHISHSIKTGKSNSETLGFWKNIQNGIFPKSSKDVEPLLTTTWWQGIFYNELCPEDPEGPGGHAATGCVATAMAQIMKYHNFPPQGIGSYSYTHPRYGEQFADFGNTNYDWDSMPNAVIYSSNIPVATLMYHCGVASNMEYGPDESGSNLTDARDALIKYFNYQPGIEWHEQNEYPEIEDWKNLIRTDLDNQLPVWYGGANLTIGHAFVCDGYRLNDETFHFNWGWGGNYNGWYMIGDLVQNYNLDNHILTNIQPYNPDIITRITYPPDNFVVRAGHSIEIKAATVRGNADDMKITIDGATVASGSVNQLTYTWNTSENDLGSHEVISWSFSGVDSVYYPINLNVSEWITRASGFPSKLKYICYISAIDSNNLWAIANDAIGNFTAPCQLFTRTSDGGETWFAGSIPNNEELTICMVQGISSQKAYAALYRLSGTAQQGVFLTTDGGNTWERQPTASFNHSFSAPCIVHFFNENNGWCMGDPLPPENKFEMYTTTDGGSNWIAVPTSNIPAGIVSDCSAPYYAAIHDTIWYGTYKGRIFKSTDKGNNWMAYPVAGIENEWVIPAFRNGSHGLAINLNQNFGSVQLFETFNGGESWNEVIYSGPLYQFGLSYVPGTENTWVSSGTTKGNKVTGASWSRDGCHTWTAFPGTEGTNFLHMAWVNDHCGWAGGYNLNDTLGGMYKFCGVLPSSPSGIDQYPVAENSFHLKVIPNPAGKKVTVVTNELIGNPSLSIYNVSGEKVLESQLIENETQIDISTLPRGVYFVRVWDEKMIEVEKIIKQ